MCAKSSMLSAETFTIAGTSQRSQIGGYFRMNPRRPGFWRPIAFSMPAGVSAIRGIALPERGCGVMPLETKAPNRSTSTKLPYSVP